MLENKVFTHIFAFMLCMGALFFSTPVHASTGYESERLTVTTAWTDGQILYIEVHDAETDAVSAIELRLSDYAENAETITIQAVDFDGNKSSVIQIPNPYYQPPIQEDDNSDEAVEDIEDVVTESDSSIPDGYRPFTPDGTGGVVDNATEQDGKEFFTVITENENVFYLIVDRQKTGENVYLLNAVTENDLMALAQKGDGTTSSGIPEPEPEPAPLPQPVPEPEVIPEPLPEPEPQTVGVGNGALFFIALAALTIGGVGYYFKIYKPNHQPPEDEDDLADYEGEDDDSESWDEDYEEKGDAK